MRLEPFKFPGCKAGIAPRIRALFPAACTGTYYEPFLGSGAVFHEINPERAHLSDLDPWIVHTHAAIRSFPTRVADRLDTRRTCTQRSHNALKSRVNRAYPAPTEAEAPEWAGDLIALISSSFQGLYRRNQDGGFNAPWCCKTSPPIPSRERILGAAARYRGATFAIESFEVAMARAGAGDWVYLDPPYAGTWSGYGAGRPFVQIGEVVSAAEQAAVRGAIVVLSHLDGLPLGPRWTVHPLDVVQRIAPKASQRGVRREILAVIGS